jgi:hypothetical protein
MRVFRQGDNDARTSEREPRCINSVSLRFVHRDNMVAGGYGAYLDQMEEVR